MTAAALHLIPSKRRDVVFSEIRELVNEVDAIDRSLERLEEGWAIDDALEAIIIKLNGELRLARRTQRIAAESEVAIGA